MSSDNVPAPTCTLHPALAAGLERDLSPWAPRSITRYALDAALDRIPRGESDVTVQMGIYNNTRQCTSCSRTGAGFRAVRSPRDTRLSTLLGVALSHDPVVRPPLLSALRRVRLVSRSFM